MNNIIGHIVGLDPVNKESILQEIPKEVKIIDLDLMQQDIYNKPPISTLRHKLKSLNKEIDVKKKYSNIKYSLKSLMMKRDSVTKQIAQSWKNQMLQKINAEFNLGIDSASNTNNCFLFVGFNVFPKDYRVRVNLLLPHISFRCNDINISNKIIVETEPKLFAMNQIRYYLKVYEKNIVQGKFPLYLLDTNHIIGKYDKFSQNYSKMGYTFVHLSELSSCINCMCNDYLQKKNMAQKKIYIATMFRTGDTMVINSKTPIEGFLTKDDALKNLRKKFNTHNKQIYIYEFVGEQFTYVNNKILATQNIHPINEEMLILDSDNDKNEETNRSRETDNTDFFLPQSELNYKSPHTN